MAATLDDLLSLALFARVVQDRSFTAAARTLGLSKSAVSARLARLEERLGVRLLYRTTRKLSPTEAGAALFARAVRMLEAADEATQAAEGASGEPRGFLRVSVPVSFSERFLAPLLPEFLARYPGLRVELATNDRIVDLVGEGFDMAVRISRLRADSSLVTRKLATDRLVVLASPEYLRRRGVPRTPADFAGHNCLRTTWKTDSVEWGFRGISTSRGPAAGGNFVTGDGNVLRAAAVAGLGLALLPSCMAAREVESGALVVVTVEGFRAGDLGIYSAHPHRTQVPPKVRALVDFLALRFAKAPWARAA